MPLLESREPDEVKEWVGLMELWFEAREVEVGKLMLKAQAGLREPELVVAWYHLDKATYQPMSFADWSKELIAYSSNQDVDTYIHDLHSDDNWLDMANHLTEDQLCTIVKAGLLDDLHACMCLDNNLRTAKTLKELASGLSKLEEVLSLDNNRIKAATSHHYKREQKDVPELHKKVIHDAHDALGHFGEAKVLEVVRKSFFWPHMQQTVHKY
ncbi:hypothetical protein CALCODRAFT_482320 [Calocera cornea HHB12733]|uniref:Integrase zinc-binding domain-containing protein n=1 Tax=Calocera cornea HHB12733 TaxID=1353952 RepID=A0A165GVS7_9BASI|nr:hypothetical protein CALCODRAFT_482320 [Calocera cornea HHB12733]